jgi:transposase InsO family protein
LIGRRPQRRLTSFSYQPTETALRRPLESAQFTSDDFTGTLERHKVTISMDGKGRYMDNIFVERLWRSLKYEEVVCCERLTSARGPAVLYRRWRMALRDRPAGVGFKPPQAAGVKSLRGERCGKRRKVIPPGAS